MYVNLCNPSNRMSVMNYISNDLNARMGTGMVCKEQGNADSVQFTLVVNGFLVPEMEELTAEFETYGECKISNIETNRGVTTFVNYNTFEHAKEAYYNLQKLKVGSIIAHPVAIKYTRMLLEFEEKLGQDKSKIIDNQGLAFDYVENFIDKYKHSSTKFDMQRETPKKLLGACSRFVENFFGWSYNSEMREFNRGKDTYTDDSSAWDSQDTANAVLDVVYGNPIVEVSITTSGPITDKIVRRSIFEHMNNDLAELETDLFGASNESNMTAKDRIANMEDFLDLSSEGLDVQDRLIQIKEKANNFSNYYENASSIFEHMNNDLAELETDLFGASNESNMTAKDRIANMEDFLDLSSEGLDVQDRLIQIKEKVNNFSNYYQNAE